MSTLLREEIGQRIAKRMNDLNLSDVDVGKIVGVSKVSAGKWRKGEAEPTGSNLTKLANALQTTPEWLATGKGEVKEIGFVNVDTDLPPQKLAPVINWVKAGLPTEMGENEWDKYEYYTDKNYGDIVYWLNIIGDSMEPLFSENDMILIDQERKPNAGQYVIARVAGQEQATFKKFKPCGYDEKLGKEYFQLVPLNDFYPTLDSRFTDFEIVGVVVEHKRILV
ncbi:LexA family protein [Faucicola mancuniensis]|uniref:LexA family protein n=1 Tax=Faucicola mancuniensis TaxID=1309795 RepID=UPI003977C2D5